LTPGDPAEPAGRVPLEATFEVRGRTAQFYYADTPREILFDARAAGDTSGTTAWQDGRLGLADGSAVRFPYRIASLPPPDVSQPGVAGRLRSAGTDYPDAIRRLYLTQSRAALPEDLDFYKQCVADALQSLPADEHDPFDETQALRNWVSKRCVYTLTLPPLPDGVDHVHAFLGDTRKGYCDMFASSLAILCRTAGIPSRLATGFAPGDPDGASFNLRAEDKHAWTEVYFPGTGWAEFDATAGTATDGTVPNAAGGPKTSWLSRFHLNLGSDMALVYPLVGIILAIAAYVAKTELLDPWRGRRRLSAGPSARQPGVSSQTAEPYRRLCVALARLGLPRRSSETPREYAARVLPELPPLEREWNVSLSPALVSSLTLAFTEALYADPSGPPPPVQPWQTRVAEFDAAARRVVRGRFWQRVLRQNKKAIKPMR
jgi:transglutaminase-like putative cysteine protease